jgi:tRNA pseudouridine38-40 synthase
MTWKLTIEYDGSKYSGWQEQNNARTVMGEIRQSAEQLFQTAVDLQGAGRTDAGVHALGQIAHMRVKARTRQRPHEILRFLNDNLPAEIAILAVDEVPESFHARHDAVARSYIYQLSSRKNAFAKKHVWWVKESLNLALMTEAAALLKGRHDFVCFRAPDPTKPGESTIVVVEEVSLEQHDDLILFRIEASHFLWRMVRRIVGVLVRLGKGEIQLADFKRLLAGHCDAQLKVSEWTAPAAGLFLERVRYR